MDLFLVGEDITIYANNALCQNEVDQLVDILSNQGWLGVENSYENSIYDVDCDGFP